MVDNIETQDQEFVVVENDIQVIGESDHSQLTNLDYEHAGHTGFASSSDIPTKVSELENDEGFVKSEDLGELATQDSVNYETQITNAPTIPTNADFTLAGLGEKSYINLTDKPTIPTEHETWTFTLDDDSEVEKEVVLWTSQT